MNACADTDTRGDQLPGVGQQDRAGRGEVGAALAADERSVKQINLISTLATDLGPEAGVRSPINRTLENQAHGGDFRAATGSVCIAP